MRRTLLVPALVSAASLPVRADVTASAASSSAPRSLVARVVAPDDLASELLSPRALRTEPAEPEVTLQREGGSERVTLQLLDVNGMPTATAVRELSILARPSSLTTRPTARELAERQGDATWVAAGIRRLHPGLVERIAAIAREFPSHPVEIVPPACNEPRPGSRHRHALAVDLRVQGVSLDVLHTFVSRFTKTGVGLLPSQNFVHVDVREESQRWIDESTSWRAAPVERIAAPPPTIDSPEGIEPYHNLSRPELDGEDLDEAVERIEDQLERTLRELEVPLSSAEDHAGEPAAGESEAE